MGGAVQGGLIVDDENATYELQLSVFSNNVDNPKQTYCEIVKPLLSSAKSVQYEPYTGGKPSPSPEYPQEIKNVGKLNEETGKYEVQVKFTDAEQDWSKEQIVTLSLDQPLRKSNEHADTVTKDGVVRKIVRETVTNVVAFNDWGVEKRYYRIVSPTSYPIAASLASSSKLKCNMCSNVTTYNNNNNNAYIVFKDYELESIGVDPDGNKNDAVVKMNEYLSQKPLIFEYPVKEPTIEPFSEDVKDALEKLKTYYPTTVITADGGEVLPDISVSYVADTKNYIDGKFAELGTTLVNTQKALL